MQTSCHLTLLHKMGIRISTPTSPQGALVHNEFHVQKHESEVGGVSQRKYKLWPPGKEERN